MSNALDDTIRRIVVEESARKDPQLAAKHFSLGKKALKAQRYKEARGHFQVALNWNANAKYYFGLGESYLGLESLDEAIKAFDEAIKLNSKKAKDCSNACCNLGTIYLNSEKLDKALEVFGKAIELYPKNVQAHYRLGKAFCEKEDYESATRALSEAIELDPKNAQAHYLLGSALLCEKSEVSKAVFHLEEAINLGLDESFVHSCLGLAYDKDGDKEEAIIHYKKAIVLKPDDAVAHNNLGNLLYEKGDFDGAIKHYKKALEVEPDNETHFFLASAYSKSGRNKEAEYHYRGAIALKPDDAVAHNNLGNLLYEKGDIDSAIKEYETAHQLKADGEVYKKSLKIAKQHKAYLIINKADEAIKECKWDDALVIYREALKVDPNNSFAHFEIGSILLMQSKYDESEYKLDTAFKCAEPDEIWLIKKIKEDQGILYFRMGDYKRASKKFKEAIDIDPNDKHIPRNQWLEERRMHFKICEWVPITGKIVTKLGELARWLG